MNIEEISKSQQKRRQCPQENCRMQSIQKNTYLLFYCLKCYQNYYNKHANSNILINLRSNRDNIQSKLTQTIDENQELFENNQQLERIQNMKIVLQMKKKMIKETILKQKKMLLEINNELRFQEKVKYCESQRIIVKQMEQLMKKQEDQLQTKKQQIEQYQIKKLKRQQTIFCQLSLLDDQCVYNKFRISDEIQQLTFMQYDSNLKSTTSVDIFERTFIDIRRYQQQEICLGLKKSIYEWKSYFSENLLYFECLIQTIRKTYYVIYYLSELFTLELPYPIYKDDLGFIQFKQYKIFEYLGNDKMIRFQESSLTQMQINIYYIKYYLNFQLDLSVQKYFDIMDLLQEFYSILKPQEHEFHFLIQDYFLDRQVRNKANNRRIVIPIKLVSIEMDKFDLDSPDSLTDEFEIIY